MSKTIPVIDENAEELLKVVSQKINDRYFGGMIKSRVIWAIPRSSIGLAGSEAIPLPELPIGSDETFIKVAEAVDQGEICRAIEILTPIAESGHDNGLKLMIILCQKANLEEDASHWAAIRNRNAAQITMPAPGSIEKENGQWSCIRIHPSLAARPNPKIPLSVIEYVVFHEMLHEFLDTKADDPHPDIFLKHEQLFKKRDKAVAWLDSRGFSTLGDCV